MIYTNVVLFLYRIIIIFHSLHLFQIEQTSDNCAFQTRFPVQEKAIRFRNRLLLTHLKLPIVFGRESALKLIDIAYLLSFNLQCNAMLNAMLQCYVTMLCYNAMLQCDVKCYVKMLCYNAMLQCDVKCYVTMRC